VNRFEMFFRRSPYDGPACVEYALIPEGKRRTLALAPGVPDGCRADDPGPSPITHVNFFAIFNDGLGLSEPWQIPPGPPQGELVSATLEVRGDEAYAAVRFGPPTGKCSETYRRSLVPVNTACETPPRGGERCQGEPCDLAIPGADTKE
jgi:hypothetical protein